MQHCVLEAPLLLLLLLLGQYVGLGGAALAHSRAPACISALLATPAAGRC
jgi:hypothetical protein